MWRNGRGSLSLFAALSVAACGSSAIGPGPSGGVDAGGESAVGAESDTASDSSSVHLEGSAGLTCGQSVLAYCAASPCTQAAILVDLCAHHFATASFTAGCGGFDVLTDGVNDAGATYYFDPTTGDLAAVVDASMPVNGSGGDTCAAGPSSFTVPRCPARASTPACTDAGSVANGDASTGDG